MSDAPDGPLETRGGMEAGNPGLEGATETGGSGAGHADTGGNADDTTTPHLPAEKGSEK